MYDKTNIDLQLELLNLKSASYDHVTGIPLVNVVYKNLVKILDQKKKIAIITISLTNGQELELSISFELYDKLLRELVTSVNQILKHNHIEKYYLVSAFHGGETYYIFVPESNTVEIDKNLIEHIKSVLERGLNLKIASFKSNFDLQSFSPSITISGRILESSGAWRSERFLARELEKIRGEVKGVSERSDDTMKLQLKKMIDERNIEIVFQPIIYITDKSIYGYEALDRGKTEEFKNSEYFLLLAHRYNLLKEVESICVFNALETFYSSFAKNKKLKNKKLFINLSPLSFSVLISDEFTEHIKSYGFSNDQIVIEFTEKFAPLDPSETKDYYDFIKRISKLTGFEIAVDDVGTGYSTLERIAELNPRYIKYDRILTKNVHKDPIKQELLKTILDFSKKLGSRLIVEGVDNNEDFEFLKSLGVEFIQGYIFGRPLKLSK
jgi:EAL domain-containing protein (putative c-di-GMP-specific phosphodiesterase class I)